jgi:hypothetical protein
MLVIAINRIAALRDDPNVLPRPNVVMNVFMFHLQVVFLGVVRRFAHQRLAVGTMSPTTSRGCEMVHTTAFVSG